MIHLLSMYCPGKVEVSDNKNIEARLTGSDIIKGVRDAINTSEEVVVVDI